MAGARAKLVCFVAALFFLSVTSLAAPPAKEASAGLAVDSSGNPAIDPTKNVIALTEAAVKRIDDLIALQDRLTEARIKALDDLRIADSRRLDELRAAESRRLDEQSALIRSYEEKLTFAEAGRLNAIRAVDAAAVSIASEKATQQAVVLANQVTASADALRTLVASTAATTATQQQTAFSQLTERIVKVENTLSESKGRQGLSDPMLAELIAEVKKQGERQSLGTGKDEGTSASWGVVVGTVGLIAGVIGIGGVIYGLQRGRKKAA